MDGLIDGLIDCNSESSMEPIQAWRFAASAMAGRRPREKSRS
jgi:hypothetical protein